HWTPPVIFTLACDTIVIISQEAFYVLTPDTSFSNLPSIAGGLIDSIIRKHNDDISIFPNKLWDEERILNLL
ncbi:MAG: hypothetical protein J6A58_00800, partial [Oscillospiraceae bacterium]|nr:hypothetical protein [Oscillospiraceae bacterium]